MLRSADQNFAAGISGGFRDLCNKDMIGLEPVVDESDRTELHRMVEDHLRNIHGRGCPGGGILRP